MGRPKRNERRSKVIGFKAFYDADQDLLDWWEGIDEGERSDVIREILRIFLSEGRRRVDESVEHVHDDHVLVQVQEDIAWLRSALNDMPAYLENLVRQVAAMAPSVLEPADKSNGRPLSDSESQRRERRMRRAQW